MNDISHVRQTVPKSTVYIHKKNIICIYKNCTWSAQENIYTKLDFTPKVKTPHGLGSKWGINFSQKRNELNRTGWVLLIRGLRFWREFSYYSQSLVEIHRNSVTWMSPGNPSTNGRCDCEFNMTWDITSWTYQGIHVVVTFDSQVLWGKKGQPILYQCFHHKLGKPNDITWQYINKRPHPGWFTHAS